MGHFDQAAWKEWVIQTVPDLQTRGDLFSIAKVFADLVGRRNVWNRGLEGLAMTESSFVVEVMNKGELKARRQDVLWLLNDRFPDDVPPEVTRVINEQESLEILSDWFRSAARLPSMNEFVRVLSQ